MTAEPGPAPEDQAILDESLAPQAEDPVRSSALAIFEVRERAYREEVRAKYDSAGGPWLWD